MFHVESHKIRIAHDNTRNAKQKREAKRYETGA